MARQGGGGTETFILDRGGEQCIKIYMKFHVVMIFTDRMIEIGRTWYQILEPTSFR